MDDKQNNTNYNLLIKILSQIVVTTLNNDKNKEKEVTKNEYFKPSYSA